MRFSTTLVVLSAAFATTSAALLETRQNGYASCALPCLTSTDPGSCALSDTHCLCTNQQFVQQTTACFEKSCSGADLQQSIDAAIAMCRSVGVTLSSSVPGPTSTGSTPSSTPTPTSEKSTNSATSNGINGLFVALGLIGFVL